MIFDAQQRLNAIDPSRSLLVEAPAGSGKTELLIQRYLRLLSLVERPESVVAMTFTRKAAAEMKERVMRALRDAEEDAPVKGEYGRHTRTLAEAVLKHEREKQWGLLEDASRLQIQTIDSFCSLLVRQMPLLSGLGGNPQVLEYADDLYRLAARRTIATLAETEEYQEIFRRLVIHFDGRLDQFAGQIAKMLLKRDQWVRALEGKATDALRGEIEAGIREYYESRFAEAYRLWPAGIPGCPAPVFESVNEWKNAHARLLTKKGEPRKTSGYAHLLSGLLEFREALHECAPEEIATVNDEQWQMLSAFISVLFLALVQLERVFEERGQVDFTRITQAAVNALSADGQPTGLAFRLDYRIEHLLIDEFQDTSLVQYALLNGLTAEWSDGDGRSLFVVGDPMQSIYRFRDAEVGLFLRAPERGIGGVRFLKLRLESNFRSTRNVVDWVNTIFPSVMPPVDDDSKGAVALRPSAAVRREAGPAVKVHVFVDDDGSREADRVVEIAAKAIQKGTVAILVRSRAQLFGILPALRRAKVAYEAVDIDLLTTEQHVLDIISLARAILHPADRLSWLACLRAPWCGLMLADLEALVGEWPDIPVPELLARADCLNQLSPEGLLRAHCLQEVLSRACRSVGRFPLREVVEGAWVALGGMATLFYDNQREDADTVFTLLSALDDGGNLDFDALAQQLEVLYARPHHHSLRAVQVMTIHGAKGLEFDTVILPQLHAGAAPLDRELLVWTERMLRDGTEGLLMAALPQSGTPDALYSFVSRRVLEKERNERKRLLYVASTRARDALHLLGNVRSKKDGSSYQKAASHTFLGLIFDAVQPEFVKAWQDVQKGRQAQQSLSLVAAPRTLLQRLPPNWELPKTAPAVPWNPPFVAQRASAQAVTFEWVGDTGRHVGAVVHDFLRRIAEDGIETWNASRVEGQRALAESELARLGVPRADRTDAASRVIDALQMILRSERGQWILADHAEARCEWQICGLSGNVLQSARIDRMFREDNGRLWIIDYKTSTHEGGSLRHFLDEEQRRYRPQLETYARLLQQAGESRVSMGLYFPLLDAWREWEAETVQAVNG